MKPRAIQRLKSHRKAMQSESGKLIPKQAKRLTTNKVKVVRGFKARGR